MKDLELQLNMHGLQEVLTNINYHFTTPQRPIIQSVLKHACSIGDDTLKVLSIFNHLSPMAERSRALDYLSFAMPGVGKNPAGDIDSFSYFSLSSRSSPPLGEARSNEIKHDIYQE